MDSARSNNSTATTPRDDRFYTPRANSIANSSEGEYFTPRFNNNGSGKFGAGAGDLTNRSARSDSDSWQTPRSARVDEPPAGDPRFRRSLSRESSLNNVTGSASSSPRIPHSSAPNANANIPSSSANSNYYYGPNSGSSGGGSNNCMSPVHEEAEDYSYNHSGGGSSANSGHHSYSHSDHYAGGEQRQHPRPAPGPSGLYGQSQGQGQGQGRAPAPRSGPFNYSPQLRNGSGRVDSPSAPAAPADSLPYPHKSPPWGQGRHRPSAQQPGSGHSAGSSASTPTSSPSVGARLQQRQGYGYGGSGLMGEPVYSDGWTSPHPQHQHQHQHQQYPAAAHSSPGHGRPHAYAYANNNSSSSSESKRQDAYGRHGYNESKGQGQGHVHDPYSHGSYADDDAEVVVDHGYGEAADDDGYGEGRGERDRDPDVDGLADDFEDADVLGVEDGVTARDVEDVFRFARHSRTEEMEKLLDAGIPVNIRDEHGATLLIIACQNGNKKILKSCLRRGADINARNFKGNTALHFCYQFGYGETLGQYLISKGADTQIRNKAGKTYFQGT